MNEIDRMSTQEQRQPDYALMKQSKYSINMAVSEISLGFAEYLQARLGRSMQCSMTRIQAFCNRRSP